MTPDQCAAARALLGWEIEQLAAAAGSTVETVAIFEVRGIRTRQKTLTKLRNAFESAGVKFTDDDGVRLGKTDSPSEAD